MRPLVSFNHVVGSVMLLYALGVLSTPRVGATAWIVGNTPLTEPMIALAFAFGGVYVLILNPPPALFSLCVLPILLYGLASVLRLMDANTTVAAATATVGHLSLWLVIMSVLYERARSPVPPPPPKL